MIIERRYLIFSIILLGLALPLIYFSCLVYKPILSLTPIFSELEVQFYLFDVFIILLMFGFFFWFSKTRFFERILKNTRRISWKFLLPMVGFVQLISIKLFTENTYLSPDFRKNLTEVGIFPYQNFSIIVLALIFLTLFIILALVVFNERKINPKLYYIFSVTVIIFLSFGVNSTNAYDYAYFAGPINDLLSGKYLLYNSPSQYGFLSIIGLSLPFRFFSLSLFNMVLLNAIGVTLGFGLIFWLMQYIFRSKLFSLVLIISIIFFNYNVQILTRGDFPQTNFLRFGWWVILGLILVAREKLSSKYSFWLDLLSLGIVAISFFWVIDNGVYVLMAYLSYKILNNLEKGFKATVSNTLLLIVKIFGAIAILFLLINLIYKILMVPINWNHYISDSQYYLGGFGLMPLPNTWWHWLIIAVYLLTLIYLISIKRFAKSGKLAKPQKLLSYILFYGIFQLTYFMGRSHVNNLHHIIIPFLICIGFFIEKVLFKIKGIKSKLFFKVVSIGTLVLVLLLPFYFVLIQAAINLKNDNLFTTLERLSQAGQIEENNVENTVGRETLNNLNQKYGWYFNTQGLTLVSERDTWFLVNLKRVNNINSNNLLYFVDESYLKKLADDIIKKQARYVFISKKSPNPNKGVQVISEGIAGKYQYKENLGSLDVWEYSQ